MWLEGDGSDPKYSQSIKSPLKFPDPELPLSTRSPHSHLHALVPIYKLPVKNAWCRVLSDVPLPEIAPVRAPGAASAPWHPHPTAATLLVYNKTQPSWFKQRLHWHSDRSTRVWPGRSRPFPPVLQQRVNAASKWGLGNKEGS